MDNIDLFTQLYETVYRDLYRFAYYTLRNRQDAEDVVSETVLSAYEQFTRLRDINSFRPWIFKILTNQCKRQLKLYVNKNLPLDEQIIPYEADKEESIDIQNALFSLSEEERIIVSLSVYGGYNSKEIAHLVKRNANTVRSKLSRALDKMEKLLT